MKFADAPAPTCAQGGRRDDGDSCPRAAHVHDRHFVFFAGAGLNRLIEPLRRWNIPEPVTGGLLAAVATLLGLCRAWRRDQLHPRRARHACCSISSLASASTPGSTTSYRAAGRSLMLLALTAGYLVIQNLIAAGSVAALGSAQGITVFVGSASLIGGHGTTIAWAPIITPRFGIANALEVGIATATLGLVVASLVGGPIAGFLIAPSSSQPDRRRPIRSSACRRARTTNRSTISAMSPFCARCWCSTW